MNPKFYFLLCLIAFIVTTGHLASSESDHDHDHEEEEGSGTRLDVFHKLVDADHDSAGSNGTLSVHALQEFVDTLIGQLDCEHEGHHEDEDDSHDDDHDDHHHDGDDHDHEHEDSDNHEDHEGESCTKFMCINATDLVTFTLGINPAAPIDEEHFEDACVVLLYLMTSVNETDLCHQEVNFTTITVEAARTHLLETTMMFAPNSTAIPKSTVTALLQMIKTLIHHDHSMDGHADEDEDHDDHAHEDEDHDDDHEDHAHEDEDDHDHDAHDDDHEDDHDDHDHDDDHDEAASLVLEEKCLSYDALVYYMGFDDEPENIMTSSLKQLASYTVYLVSIGSHVEDNCRQLPYTAEFGDTIFQVYSTAEGNLDLAALMMKMGISQNASTTTETDDHSGHNHRRRRRSLPDAAVVISDSFGHLRSRKKRQTTSVSPGLTSCYSASQIMALYDSSSGVDKDTFEALCPALVSQAVFADCTQADAHDDHDDDNNGTEAERYGYGTLAVFIICVSSILGIVIFPCASSSVYGNLMSTFLGLAVGTLFADAVLHLIPNAMGVHVHDDHDHDHGSGDYKVEEYARFGLAIMGGLYVFYLLELFMAKVGGHSHDHDHSETQVSDAGFFDIGMKSVENVNTVEKGLQNGKPDGHYDNIEGNVNGKASNYHPDNVGMTNKKKSVLSPLALMILIGDAIHNFADGLAIAAAFSSSLSTGVATSIAVICHELPHELGDFAVLLQSGCSMKKAVVLNLLSAVTAFAGLYVGLIVATSSETQRWIFAVAAGMFIYIALVDLLPQLSRTKNGFHIMLNNIGIILGYGIMLLIAVFEEHIEV